MQSLSDLEKQLLHSHGLLIIRGKRGRGVPILIPPDVEDLLCCLADPEIRKLVGVQDSIYLFPNFGK